MSSTFSIRLATEGDAPILWQLFLRNPQLATDYFGHDESQLARDLRAGWIRCFLVENISGHKAVGFCVASLAYSTWFGQYLNLSAMFVEPEFRGRHLCSALVTAACRFNRDVLKTTRVDCTVPESNLQMVAALQRCEFYNINVKDRWISFLLDSRGLHLALKSELRPGVCLEGFGDVRGTSSAAYIVRPGCAADAKDVLSLVRGLTRFHKFDVEMELTAERLAADIESGACGCVVAMERANMKVVGMTISWCFLKVESGLIGFLEDIFLDSQHRGFGVGKALLVGTCLWARAQGATAVDLRAVDWNTRAHAVYKNIGFEDETNRAPIIDFRCDKEHLERLLTRNPPEGITFRD